MNRQHHFYRRRSVLSLAMGVGLVAPLAHAAPLLGAGGRRAVAPNAWIEVDLGKFEQNIVNVQQSLAGSAKLCAIMKADAYGLGIETLMPSVLKARIPCIGIASTEEARMVRACGFKGRLLRVRSAAPSEIEAALRYNVEDSPRRASRARAPS